jgi:uridine kinase
MKLGPGEPAAGPWRIEPIHVFADLLAGTAGDPAGRPRIVAVDGRGGGGKTALANRLCRQLQPAAVVHSDDLAWHHSRFGWDDLMIDGVLAPLRAGRAVRYQPPAWRTHGRHHHLELPAGLSTVLVEGVGVSRRSLVPLLDAAVWVQSDLDEARERAIRRDIAEHGWTEAEALRNWYEWEDEELPFLGDDRPWERCCFIVCTASGQPHDPATEVVVSANRSPSDVR